MTDSENPDPTPADVTPEKPVRDCPAGKECAGKWEIEEPRFRVKDYIYMAIGVSSRPVPIARRCAVCGHVWEVIEDARPW